MPSQEVTAATFTSGCERTCGANQFAVLYEVDGADYKLLYVSFNVLEIDISQKLLVGSKFTAIERALQN